VRIFFSGGLGATVALRSSGEMVQNPETLNFLNPCLHIFPHAVTCVYNF